MALSLVAPVGLAGFAYLKQDDPDRFRLTPGLVQALRTKVPARDVVFSDLETSYRIEAYAPVYVSAAPPAHVADTKDNYPQKRRDAVIRFLNTRQRGDPAPLPRRLDRRREPPLRPEARPAEGLRGLAVHPLPPQDEFATVNGNDD